MWSLTHVHVFHANLQIIYPQNVRPVNIPWSMCRDWIFEGGHLFAVAHSHLSACQEGVGVAQARNEQIVSFQWVTIIEPMFSCASQIVWEVGSKSHWQGSTGRDAKSHYRCGIQQMCGVSHARYMYTYIDTPIYIHIFYIYTCIYILFHISLYIFCSFSKLGSHDWSCKIWCAMARHLRPPRSSVQRLLPTAADVLTMIYLCFHYDPKTKNYTQEELNVAYIDAAPLVRKHTNSINWIETCAWPILLWSRPCDMYNVLA